MNESERLVERLIDRQQIADRVAEACGSLPPSDIAMTVYRNGEFVMGTEATVHKCGIEGKKRFRFEAWFRATAAELDRRGFAVDNADLFRYFRDRASQDSFDSCELLCLRAMEFYRTTYPGATQIRVRIWGLEDVTYVEAEWPQPKAEPRSFAEAVEDLLDYTAGRS